MVCVQCGQKTQVINSRPRRRTNQVWRRRKCYNCGAIFTTTEVTDYEAVWRVIGRQGDIVPFKRDKLFLSLQRCCQHRPDGLQDASDLTETVIKKLLNQAKGGRLDCQTIAAAVQVALNRFDTAASVQYAAFHKS